MSADCPFGDPAAERLFDLGRTELIRSERGLSNE